jgi:hypothetical protein
VARPAEAAAPAFEGLTASAERVGIAFSSSRRSLLKASSSGGGVRRGCCCVCGGGDFRSPGNGAANPAAFCGVVLSLGGLEGPGKRPPFAVDARPPFVKGGGVARPAEAAAPAFEGLTASARCGDTAAGAFSAPSASLGGIQTVFLKRNFHVAKKKKKTTEGFGRVTQEKKKKKIIERQIPFVSLCEYDVQKVLVIRKLSLF